MRRVNTPGMSLVEVLVALVLLIALAAFLLPRLAGRGGKDASGKTVTAPRDRARQVVGASNTQQINQAIQMYRMDHDNRNPPNLQALKTYGLTDEMLLDPVTRQPLAYDPRTGTVAGGTPLGRVPGF